MTDTEKDKKQRSPAYPFIGLAEAINRATQFHKAEGRHPARVATAAGHWGYKEKSSGGLQTISAMKQFGLMADEGAGSDRKVRLTPLALKIILDEVTDSPQRKAAIAKAALSPKLFADLFARWGTKLPSDENFRTYLRLDLGYNDVAVHDVVKNYKATLAYAEPDGSDTITGKDGDAKDKVVVGDYVQWESQGVYQFEAPKRVTNVEDGYVFVEGTFTGMPLEQVQKVDPPAMPPPMLQGNQFKPQVGAAREVSSLPEGEAMLQWPATLSAESVKDLEDWLALVVKKLKRRYADQKPE